MPRLFPVFLKLEHKTVLIVGGGRLARQKLRTLAPAGANVRLVAPEIAAECLQWPGSGTFEALRRPFAAEDLESADLVFAATGDAEFNHRVVELARAAGLLANAVDDPGHCDFFTPAVVRRGTLTLAVSSDGRLPGLTRAVRELLEEWLPERDDGLMEALVAARAELRASRFDSAARAAALRGLIARFRDEYLDPRRTAGSGPSGGAERSPEHDSVPAAAAARVHTNQPTIQNGERPR
jgi:siroheme synthase-like protein